MTMTREQAIRNYVEHLIGDDLAQLLQHMNAYDGCFEEATYYDMDEFDEFMSNYTPMEIAQMIYFGEFNPNDEYFRFNAYGNLESADWPDLDDLVDADDDTMFDADFDEILEDDDE